jgi:hypothetical protein
VCRLGDEAHDVVKTEGRAASSRIQILSFDTKDTNPLRGSKDGEVIDEAEVPYLPLEHSGILQNTLGLTLRLLAIY